MDKDMRLFLKYNNINIKTTNYFLNQDYNIIKDNRDFVYNDLKRFLNIQWYEKNNNITKEADENGKTNINM